MLHFYPRIFNSRGMQNILGYSIKTIENKWLKKVSEEVELIFKDTFLPSHDLTHHRRVWKFAKDLLFAYQQNEIAFSPDFIEALMIAVFFHDTGLSKSFDSAHGLAGSQLAEKFIIEKTAGWNNSFTKEMFEAIVKHDDKNYIEKIIGNSPGIYQILTIADDLDALGCLGLIRYFEIYFQRNIRETEVCERIKSNITSRFAFISEHIGTLTELMQIHQYRYEQVLQYIEKLSMNDVEILKKTIENKIDPLKIDQRNIISNSIANLISEAQSELAAQVKTLG